MAPESDTELTRAMLSTYTTRPSIIPNNLQNIYVTEHLWAVLIYSKRTAGYDTQDCVTETSRRADMIIIDGRILNATKAGTQKEAEW